MSLAPPGSLRFEIHLGSGVRVHPGECPSVGQVWKKKPGNWPEGRQRPRRTALYKWLNRLITALLLTRRGVHTLPLRVCISALLLPQLSRPFLCVLPLLFCVSDNKLCTCIYSFCLCDKRDFFSTGDKNPGENNSLASSPLLVWCPGFLVPIQAAAAAAAKLLQSCPTLCDPIDGSPPGYAVPGILQVEFLGRELRSRFTPLLTAAPRSSDSPAALLGNLLEMQNPRPHPALLIQKLLFTYLALPCHCWGMQTLSYCLWDLVPWPGIKPGTLYWELGVLAAGPPEKSQHLL